MKEMDHDKRMNVSIFPTYQTLVFLKIIPLPNILTDIYAEKGNFPTVSFFNHALDIARVSCLLSV